MEAVILTVGMIALASYLTFNRPSENRKKIYRNNQEYADLQRNSGNNENIKTEKCKEPPYYERFISRASGNDFLDYSGGMMGI